MKRILIQLDTDPLPSTFDRVVAVDAGAEEVFSYGGVSPANVTSLVHGAIFTRGPDQLHHTAIFIGGSDVEAGEELLQAVERAFFGPMRVAVMMDSNGSNTTAAAAVRAAARHLSIAGTEALVLGGTGPVGHRVAQILAMQGASVRIASRSQERAQKTCEAVQADIPDAQVEVASVTEDGRTRIDEGTQLLVSAGAAGVRLLSEADWQSTDSLQVAIDLNAVPPAGLEGINVTDKGKEIGGVTCYGAIAVGGIKMKLHKAAIQKLFESNSTILDTKAIARLSEEMA